ncbi:MAG: hypothetical protein KDB18_14320, partial [Salinibacterium sp.]|nr:hypothetical protein [Salinibacterium sp.]
MLRDRISQALHRPRYLHADRAIAKFRKDVRHAIAGGERRLDLDVSALQELDPEADDYVHLHLVLAVIALEVADHDGLRLRVLGVPRLLVDILASWHNIGDVAKNLAALKGRVALAE